MPFVVDRRRMPDPPPSPPRRVRESIDGHLVEISIFESPGSYATTARWTEPRELWFTSRSQTPEAMELVRTVYRTVRFGSR